MKKQLLKSLASQRCFAIDFKSDLLDSEPLLPSPIVKRRFNQNTSSGYSSNESIIAKRESIKRLIPGGGTTQKTTAASGFFKQSNNFS